MLEGTLNLIGLWPETLGTDIVLALLARDPGMRRLFLMTIIAECFVNPRGTDLFLTKMFIETLRLVGPLIVPARSTNIVVAFEAAVELVVFKKWSLTFGTF